MIKMSKEFQEQFEKDKEVAKQGKPLDAEMVEECEEEDEGAEETKQMELEFKESKQNPKSKFGNSAPIDEEDDDDACDEIGEL